MGHCDPKAVRAGTPWYLAVNKPVAPCVIKNSDILKNQRLSSKATSHLSHKESPTKL